MIFSPDHVSLVGLTSTADEVVWQYAKAKGFTFVTKDKDFGNLSLALGRTSQGNTHANGQLFDHDNRAHSKG